MKVKALKSFTYSHITPEYRTRDAAIGQIIDDFPESLQHLIKKKYVEEIKDEKLDQKTETHELAMEKIDTIKEKRKKKGRPKRK